MTGVIAVQTSLALAWAILAEASLSFLGLGPPPPSLAGEMVADSSSLASVAWWTLAGPSLVIVLAVIGFNFLRRTTRRLGPQDKDTFMKVVGIISGTSFDAIEAVAVELSLVDRVVTADLLGHLSIEYSPEIRDGVASMLPPNSTTIGEVCRLDTMIGHSFAEVAGLLSDQYFDGAVDVVCSHGQTVFHWVEDGRALGTLQIGQPAWIAERTGATIVADVRSRDVAAGGHGAPLASLVDVFSSVVIPTTSADRSIWAASPTSLS